MSRDRYDDRLHHVTPRAAPDTFVSPVRVTVLRSPAAIVVAVAGEADIATSPQLQHELVAAFDGDSCSATVDVSALAFCGLAGMDALEKALAYARHIGFGVTVRGESAQLAWLRRTFGNLPRN